MHTERSGSVWGGCTLQQSTWWASCVRRGSGARVSTRRPAAVVCLQLLRAQRAAAVAWHQGRPWERVVRPRAQQQRRSRPRRARMRRSALHAARHARGAAGGRVRPLRLQLLAGVVWHQGRPWEHAAGPRAQQQRRSRPRRARMRRTACMQRDMQGGAAGVRTRLLPLILLAGVALCMRASLRGMRRGRAHSSSGAGDRGARARSAAMAQQAGGGSQPLPAVAACAPCRRCCFGTRAETSAACGGAAPSCPAAAAPDSGMSVHDKAMCVHGYRM
jgi:hypothetical protein